LHATHLSSACALRQSAHTLQHRHPGVNAAQEELLVVGAIGFAIANIVVIAALLITADKKKSAAQVAHWSKGELVTAHALRDGLLSA
jgi:hypothetical protein